MTERTWFETVKLEGGQLTERLGQLIHEGNVRRIVIRQDETIIAEFPLTIGVVGALIAPVVAAIGALVALLANCTIEVERGEPVTPPAAPVEEAMDEVLAVTDV